MKKIISTLLLGTLLGCAPKAAFVDDPDVIGKWKSVDYVKSIEDFTPEAQIFKGELVLQAFEFKDEGETHKPFWTWTKGSIHHSGDKSDAKYVIKSVSGEQYIFMEWMSGDVLKAGKKPHYYVLKKQTKQVGHTP